MESGEYSVVLIGGDGDTPTVKPGVEQGDLVRWAPPTESIRRSVPLRDDHPGVAVSVSPRHVLVDWVDRRDSLAQQSAFAPEWLVVIGEKEFDQLSRRIPELDAEEGAPRHQTGADHAAPLSAGWARRGFPSARSDRRSTS